MIYTLKITIPNDIIDGIRVITQQNFILSLISQKYVLPKFDMFKTNIYRYQLTSIKYCSVDYNVNYTWKIKFYQLMIYVK